MGVAGAQASVRGYGEVPPLQSPAPPRVRDKPSPYCSQMPPPRCPRVDTCHRTECRGEKAPRKQRERDGPAAGPALLEGSGEVGEDLKTTRINRFVYQEQARVSPAK